MEQHQQKNRRPRLASANRPMETSVSAGMNSASRTLCAVTTRTASAHSGGGTKRCFPGSARHAAEPLECRNDHEASNDKLNGKHIRPAGQPTGLAREHQHRYHEQGRRPKPVGTEQQSQQTATGGERIENDRQARRAIDTARSASQATKTNHTAPRYHPDRRRPRTRSMSGNSLGAPSRSRTSGSSGKTRMMNDGGCLTCKD